MANKLEGEDPAPKQLSLFRLVVDQARVTEEVANYPYAGSGTTEDPYVITYLPNDAGNPFTWSERRRWTITLIAAVECLATAFASSAFSGILQPQFHDAT
jgi:hypothetical protein